MQPRMATQRWFCQRSHEKFHTYSHGEIHFWDIGKDGEV